MSAQHAFAHMRPAGGTRGGTPGAGASGARPSGAGPAFSGKPVPEAAHRGGFVHEAFVYRGEEEFLAGTTEFVRAGLAAGESVLVAVPPERERLLRAALGPDAARTSFLDIVELGRNPARIIPAWRDFLDEVRERGTGARGIGEPVWAGRSPAELDECHLHESLTNFAFGSGPGWLLRCPYDAAALPAHVIEQVWRTHPRVVESGRAQVSDRYLPPHAVSAGTVSAGAVSADTASAGSAWPEPWHADGLPPAAGLLAGPLPEPGEGDRQMLRLGFAAASLAAARRAVVSAARERGVDADRVADLELAVHEVITNSVRHGGGSGELRVWAAASALVCEVRDRGRLVDPLVGRRRPDLTADGGRGLWLANQICDLVQVRSSAAGTVVRLHLAAPQVAPSYLAAVRRPGPLGAGRRNADARADAGSSASAGAAAHVSTRADTRADAAAEAEAATRRPRGAGAQGGERGSPAA